MFSVEFESCPPIHSPAYYSLVVRRDPYVLGRLPTCDISLPDFRDVSRQHVKLEVVRFRSVMSQSAMDESSTHPTSTGEQPSPSRGLFLQRGSAASMDDVATPPHSASSSPARKRFAGEEQLGSAEFAYRSLPLAFLGTDDDPLLLRVTNIGRHGFRLQAPPRRREVGSAASSLSPGQPAPTEASESVLVLSSAFVPQEGRLIFGSHCTLRVTFRPVLVSIARDYSPEYISELEGVYRLLGATNCGGVGPSPCGLGGVTVHTATFLTRGGAGGGNAGGGSSTSGAMQHSTFQPRAHSALALHNPPPSTGSRASQPQTPIVALHVAEVVADDSWTLAALACGFTITQPMFLVEWFGEIAANACRPLHELPSPSEYECAKKSAAYGNAVYLRPEPPTCPFTLYANPAANNGSVKRSREGLFTGKVFYAASEICRLRNSAAIAACGGLVVETLRQALQASVGRVVGNSSHPSDEGSSFWLTSPVAMAMVVSSSKYILLEEHVADHVSRTTDADLKAFSRARANRSLAGTNDDGLLGASMSSLPASYLNEGTSVAHDEEDDDATMRLFCRLYVLVHRHQWFLVREKSVHVALLVNKFTPEFVSFQVSARNTAVVSPEQSAPEAMASEHGHALPDRSPLHAMKDAQVYRFIQRQKENPVDDGSDAQHPSALRVRQAPAISSPAPRNPARNGSQQRSGDDCSSDHTPSTLGSGASDSRQKRIDTPNDNSDAHGGHRLTFDEERVLRGVSPLRQLRATTADEVPRGSAGILAPLSVFEARVEPIARTIRKLFPPSQLTRLDGIAAGTRKNRTLDPIDRTFALQMRSLAEAQLRALECASHEAAEEVGASHRTRSAALQCLWDTCSNVVRRCDAIFDLGAAASGDASRSPRSIQRLHVDASAQLPRGHEPEHPEDLDNDCRCLPEHNHRTMRSSPRTALRPGTKIVRYPAPMAAFLGPNQHHRGRAELSEAHQLTARIVAPVQPANLHAVAEKRRLFVKKFGNDEGMRRFSLWMSSHDSQWTDELYRTLESKQLDLLEMLRYE